MIHFTKTRFANPAINLDDLLGFIPQFFSPADPRPARDQANENYAHGGGWSPFDGFELRSDGYIKYPGDPAMPPLAIAHLRDEEIILYPHFWLMIKQPDGSFEISRMD